LIPLNVKSGDLSGGLRDLAERQEQLRDLACSFTKTGSVPTLCEQTTTHLYHIASEAVLNAAQHANASTVTVCLNASADQLVLEVRDDGVGIPEETSLHRGAGLHLMEARANLIGADLEIRPCEGGTLVRCSLPLSDTGEAPT
jgi:signal transduction histidine kinase